MAFNFKAPRTEELIITLLIAIAFLYLLAQILSTGPCETVGEHGCTQQQVTDGARWYDIHVPQTIDLQSSSMFIFKILIIGVVVIGAYAIMLKFMGGNFNRADVMTLIIIGVLLWVIWDVVLSKVLNSATLTELAGKMAQKLGQ